jgi:hypothetical protein
MEIALVVMVKQFLRKKNIYMMAGDPKQTSQEEGLKIVCSGGPYKTQI